MNIPEKDFAVITSEIDQKWEELQEFLSDDQVANDLWEIIHMDPSEEFNVGETSLLQRLAEMTLFEVSRRYFERKNI